MPNQRAKNKVRFGGYIEKKLYREVAAEAKKAGWKGGVFGYMVHLLEPIVDAKYRHLEAKRNSRSLRRKKTPRKKR